MRAGLLRHQVVFEKKTQARHEIGEMQDTWSDVFANPRTSRARINPKASKESNEADQAVARLTHEITIRARTGITANMRVVFGARTFYIDGPPRNWDERGVHMIFDAREET